MSHEAHPNPNLQDDPSSTPLIMGGALGTLITIATVIVLTGLYYSEERDFKRTMVWDKPEAPVIQLYEEQKRAMASYRWVKDTAGKSSLQIPIDQSMKITARELAAGTYKVPPPPTPAPTAAPGAKPPAAGSAPATKPSGGAQG